MKRIAIVIPSLFSDEKYLKVCETAIGALDPAPDSVHVYRNNGSAGLGVIRTKLFNDAFEYLGCDIALQCSSDFQLFPDILKYVAADRITTFAFLSRKLSMPIQFAKFLVSPGMWTGCYTITREIWEVFKKTPWFHSWDGKDSDIVSFTGEMGFPIKRIRLPKYNLLRPSEKMIEFVKDLPLHKKILKLGAWF